MKLSAIFDGEEHELVPGEDFPETGASLVVDGWEEVEEEDELSPFESPSLEPSFRDTRTLPDDPRFPLTRTEQAWGTLSIALNAFCTIAGVDKTSYQRINHNDHTTWFTFQTKEHVTERM